MSPRPRKPPSPAGLLQHLPHSSPGETQPFPAFGSEVSARRPRRLLGRKTIPGSSLGTLLTTALNMLSCPSPLPAPRSLRREAVSSARPSAQRRAGTHTSTRPLTAEGQSARRRRNQGQHGISVVILVLLGRVRQYPLAKIGINSEAYCFQL